MTSKQRAYLKSLAMKIDPIYNIGKGSISPELVQGVRDALEARELIKIGVLQKLYGRSKRTGKCSCRENKIPGCTGYW